MPSPTRTMTYVLALMLTLSTIGCSSKDKHVFLSTVNQPTTLVLIDTYSSEAVWEMDIPVNHKLVLDFDGTATGQTSDGVSPSWVDWKLYRADDLPTDAGKARKGKLVRSDRVDLTGKKVLMQTSFRPSPETPGSVDAAPVPVQNTPQAVAEEAIAESKALDPQEEMIEEEAVQDEAVEEETMDAVEQANDEAMQEVQEAAEESVEAVEESSEEAHEDVIEDALEADVAEEAATQPTK
jgi:hypothetical protein